MWEKTREFLEKTRAGMGRMCQLHTETAHSDVEFSNSFGKKVLLFSSKSTVLTHIGKTTNVLAFL